MKRQNKLAILLAGLLVLVLVAAMGLGACAPTPAPTPTPTPAPEFEPVVWKASDTPLMSVPFFTYWLTDAPGDLSAATGGLVTWEQHAGLYGASDLLLPLSDGIIQINGIPLPNFQSQVSEWALMFLPFSVDSHEEFTNFLSQGGFKLLGEDVVARYGFDLVPFFTFSAGEQWIWSNKPIRTVEDFKGLNIRSHPGLKEIFTDLGAAYTSVPFEEISLAMDRGVIDGATLGTGTSLSIEFYQSAPYRNMWPLVTYFPYMIFVNKTALDSLPKDLRDTVTNFLNEKGRWTQEELEYQIRAEFDTKLEAAGVIDVVPSAAEVAKARAIGEQYIRAWAEEKPEHMELIRLLEQTSGRTIL